MSRKKSGLFDQSKYIQQFMKDKVTVKKVTFNKKTDADLLEWLADKKFSTYVKELIRKDMNKKPLMVCDMCSDYNHTTHECDNMDSPFWNCPTLESDYCSRFHCEIETK